MNSIAVKEPGRHYLKFKHWVGAFHESNWIELTNKTTNEKLEFMDKRSFLIYINRVLLVRNTGTVTRQFEIRDKTVQDVP